MPANLTRATGLFANARQVSTRSEMCGISMCRPLMCNANSSTSVKYIALDVLSRIVVCSIFLIPMDDYPRDEGRRGQRAARPMVNFIIWFSRLPDTNTDVPGSPGEQAFP
ncbi:hypothetical protein [Mycobacterium sp. URHB0021]